MSVDRIELLLRSRSIKVKISGRQQITPSMNITCHGILTKWIIGANWKKSGKLFPQLQIWDKTRGKTYKLINSTQVDVEEESYSNVYELDVCPPIPVQPGYVLGVFLPPEADSKLSLRAEISREPVNFYVSTSFVLHVIDLNRNNNNISSRTYNPLVSVEIGKRMKLAFIPM